MDEEGELKGSICNQTDNGAIQQSEAIIFISSVVR